MYNVLSRLFIKKPNAEVQADVEQRATSGAFAKILIADDNKVNMLLAKTILKKIAPSATIIAVENGTQAVAEFDRLLPDIIFMDIQMPEMNGYDATKLIRAKETGKNVPIIALTAGNVMGEKERCLEAGMDDFIAKPFVEDTINEMLEKWRNKKNDETPMQQDDATHFNVDKLKIFLGGSDADDETVREVLHLAIEELGKLKDMIKSDAAKTMNVEEWNMVGHKVYGTSSSTGLMQLAKISRDLEKISSSDNGALNTLLANMHDELKLVIGLLKKFIAQ